MKKCAKKKAGFGITEVMIAAAVLGFLYLAVLNLQKGNHDAFLRIRGRDGAIEVAQQVMDSLKSLGISAIASNDLTPTTIQWEPYQKSWDRGLGGTAVISYTPTIEVAPTAPYVSTAESKLESVQHLYAKQVNVKIEWEFNGSTQSINVSGVIK